MPYTALATGALAYWRFLEAHGVEPAAVFTEAGFDPAALNDHNARVSEAALYRLAKACAAIDPLVGLELAKHWHPSMVHALGYAWLASDTLRDGFERLSRYYRIVSDRDLFLVDDVGEHFEVTTYNPDPSVPLAEEDIEGGLAIVLRMCRDSAGASYAPISLQLRRAAPAGAAAYTEYFRAPVHWGANRDTMTLASEGLDTPLPTSNIEVARASERIIVDYLERHHGATISMRVRERLTELLPSGHVTQDAVAQRLHISPRTMQRRLAEEGTGFRELVEEARRELAEQYLRDGSTSVKEITYLLGFSDPANFNRAFRRWTGTSPSAFRAAGRAEPAAKS